MALQAELSLGKGRSNTRIWKSLGPITRSDWVSLADKMPQSIYTGKFPTGLLLTLRLIEDGRCVDMIIRHLKP